MQPALRSPTNQNIAPITLAIVLILSTVAPAFPPAPHHEIYGMVRDEYGNPVSEDAVVTLLGVSRPILSGGVDPFQEPGVNYLLKVPMDAGTLAQLYQSTAMRPAMPFTAKVTIGGVQYVPIEVQGGMLEIGEPGGRTRLNLTLGADRDGDGLPDAWEEEVIGAIDGLGDLADVTPEGDADGDGVSNFTEYLAGTYAFDKRAVFRFEVVEVRDGFAHLRFLAVKGRTYRLFAGVKGDDLAPVSFSLEADGSDERSLLRADSIRFQDIYVPAEVAGGKQIFRLHAD